MTEREFDFEKDVAIDVHALDIEWAAQPSIYLRYSEALAEARKVYDEAKVRLETTKASVDSEIREEIASKEGKKPTEAAIANMVILDPRVQEAQAEVIRAKGEVETIGAAVRALEQKKDALENLVRLLGQQYFAGPTAPRELSNEKVAQRRATKNAVREKMERQKEAVKTSIRRTKKNGGT